MEVSEAVGGRGAVRVRLHLVALAGAVGFAGFVALVAALVVRHNTLAEGLALRVVLGGVVVALAGFVGPVLRRIRWELALVDGHVRLRTGHLRVRGLVIPVVRLAEVRVHETALGRRLGYGTILLEDVEGGIAHFGPAAGAERFRAAVAPLVVRPRGGRRRA